MKQRETHYACKDGRRLPFKQWHGIGYGFSVMPMDTRAHKIRHDATGEIHQPPGKYGPGNDSLMMALYCNYFPESYARHCFGSKLVDSAMTETVNVG
jgi:hypothetical protein